MTRRHNRHFALHDNLTRCSGVTTYKDYQCSNWGNPQEDGTYWCYQHKSQAPRAETKES